MLEQFKETLRNAGVSVTAARCEVFEKVGSHGPLMMADLVRLLQHSTDRASVYRAVELFERLGIVQRIYTGWKYKLELTDSFHEHHHHLTCTQCGTLYDIPEDSAIESYMQQLATAQQFLMTKHQLEIQGVCSTCKNAAPSN
jgi:Fur family ferric uptake transcriptional regulator